MKPAPFEYYRPETVDEALGLLAEHGSGAKLLAGGQSLVPTMNFRLAQPAVLIDLNALAELEHIEPDGDALRIGAMTRQRQVERSALVAERAPLLHEAVPFIGHPQIRNRGTIGGSIAHADPAAELPVVMLARRARLHVRNRRDARSIPVDEFFTGLFATALGPEEILVDIELPAVPPSTGWAFDEVARRHGDFALVGAAAVVTLDDLGRCRDVRLVFSSVGDGPVLAHEAARQLEGEIPDDAAVRAAAGAAAERDVDPPSDIHASAAYRRQLVRVIGTRVLARAVERARNGSVS